MDRLRRWYAWFLRHAPRMRDVLFAAFGLLTVVLQASDSGWSSGDWFVAGAGVIASLALIWRRRYPVTVAVITIVAMIATQIFIPMCLALLTLAIRRRDLALVVLGVAGYAAYISSYWTGDAELWLLVFTGPFMIGTWIAAGAYIGARRDLLVSLRDRAERAEAERELRAEQARLGERSRIAQEMHDVLAHKVSLIALHAGGLEINPAVGPEKVESSAGLIRETARQAMEDLREVLGVLRSDLSIDGEDLAPVPRAADLARLVEASRAAGVAVTSEIALPEDVPDQLGRTVYRIVQEALTNVHKHARGASTEVVVRGTQTDGVTARVTNVRPVAADALLPGAGAGLVGLLERVDLIGGRLSVGPTDTGGWRVEAWLPWPRTAPSPMSAQPTEPSADAVPVPVDPAAPPPNEASPVPADPSDVPDDPAPTPVNPTRLPGDAAPVAEPARTSGEAGPVPAEAPGEALPVSGERAQVQDPSGPRPAGPGQIPGQSASIPGEPAQVQAEGGVGPAGANGGPGMRRVDQVLRGVRLEPGRPWLVRGECGRVPGEVGQESATSGHGSGDTGGVLAGPGRVPTESAAEASPASSEGGPVRERLPGAIGGVGAGGG